VSGQLVSVWHRNSPRHKWLCELSLVRVLKLDGNHLLVQTSETGRMHRAPDGHLCMTGATGMNMRATIKGETWERELRDPVWEKTS
jgi:sucrose-6-phosphate hydrolase SacC (GH32 family)